MVSYQNLDVKRRGAGMYQVDGLWVAQLRHKKSIGVFLGRHPHTMKHGHGLGGGGGFVQERGIGNLHARQVNNHGLEIKQHLQASLRNLGLVGRIGGVPGGVFENIPQDYVGRDGVVVARSNKRLKDLILKG